MAAVSNDQSRAIVTDIDEKPQQPDVFRWTCQRGHHKSTHISHGRNPTEIAQMADLFSSLSTAQLVKVFNAATGGSVKRFETRSKALGRTRAACDNVGMTPDQALRIAGIETPSPVQEAIEAEDESQDPPAEVTGWTPEYQAHLEQMVAEQEAEPPGYDESTNPSNGWRAPEIPQIPVEKKRDTYGYVRRVAKPKMIASQPVTAESTAGVRATVAAKGSPPKMTVLLDLLKREEGATRSEMQIAMGWKSPPAKYHKQAAERAGLSLVKITRPDGAKALSRGVIT
jgi:hypothetical protein